MNLTRLTKYLAVFIACLQLYGCDMDQKVYNTITGGSFPNTEADVNSLVSGSAYNVFSPRKMFGAAAGYQMLSDMLTDIGVCAWGDWEPLMYNSYEASEWLLLGGGRSLFAYYNQISAMTLTIDRIKDVDMSEQLKDRYIAELKCGRAFLAFLLYDLYGPLPLPDLETLKNPLADKIVPRLSEEEMQEYIITNLEEAGEVLPYQYKSEDYGRFTKGLTKTILLKLYMYLGDWDK
ncbi:MAG: RagB/SusD family nutrient uptake outer membrane protein, partial [Bacteroides sp.]